MKKISLVLSGGGSRGAYHLGVIKALEELGFEISAISGASIGSIVGASYLSGKKPEEILEFFMKEKFKKALKFNLFRGGVFKIDYNHSVLDEILDTKYKNIEDLPKPLYVCVANLKKGYAEYKSSGNLKELVCASSSLYPVFSAVVHNGEKLVDGGFVDNFPINPLLDKESKILGVNLHPNVYKEGQSTLKRVIFVSWYSAGMDEKKKKCDYYLTSNELSEHFILKVKCIDKLYTLGYEKTKEMFL